MDIYGYQSYQYNQPDELAKQMFAQQALGSSLPCDRGEPEPHYMPAPSGAPWNVQGMPWGLPSPPPLVQFNAQTSSMEPKVSPIIHCKRKSFDVEPVIPAKQLITEDKMAAHLSGLHISSDYTTHTLAAEESMDLGLETPSTSSAQTNTTPKLKGTIVLAEELKKIKEEPLLPAALIERLEKPHMSLVVWKPKEEILKIKESADDSENNNNNEGPVRRNGLLVAEGPGMDMEI